MRPDTFFIQPTSLRKRILLIGAGSLGNGLRGALHAMGHDPEKIRTVDPDVWEERNKWNNIWPGEPGQPKAQRQDTIQNVLEGVQEETLSSFDIVILATDNIASRKYAAEKLTPRMGFLNVSTGINTATATLGDSEYILSSMTADDDSIPDLGCSQRGSMAHTFSVVGLGLCRLLFALKEETWPNSLVQVSLGITTRDITSVSLTDSAFETAVTA